MPHHGDHEEHRDGRDAPDGGERSRPEEILAERADEPTVSDEEAVLAYNANAERPDTLGTDEAGGESGEADGTGGRGPARAE